VLARIFKHGAGSGYGALAYLLSDKDHTGALRENPPEVLRGDPEAAAELIDSLGFAQRYTSGVLSFTQDDAVRLEARPEERLELIDSFERDFLVPGIDPDRLATVWVQHWDHGRTELHFIIANVDLETQKRFPAYFDRADRTRLATWQDFHNLSRGLDDPRAPERQRAVSRDLKLPMEKAALAEVLEKLIAQKCVSGELEDRNAIVQFIESKNLKVGRQGKDYITVICGEEKNDRFRLKGALFHEDFRPDRTVTAGVERDNGGDQEDRTRRTEQVRIRLETAMQFRRDYLEKRFGRVPDRAGDRDRDIQDRPEVRNLGGLERADGPVSVLEKGRSEVDAETYPDGEAGNLLADRFDPSSLQPYGHRDLVVDAKGALERSHLTPDHEERQELSGDRRSNMEQLQFGGRSEESLDRSALQNHRDHQSEPVEDHNDHTDERVGRPSHGILAAIERGISAARDAFNRAAEELHRVLHGTVERAHAAARSNREAIGRADAALHGHPGTHASSRETVERFERKAQMRIDRVRYRGMER
jgi:hypothetical protein